MDRDDLTLPLPLINYFANRNGIIGKDMLLIIVSITNNCTYYINIYIFNLIWLLHVSAVRHPQGPVPVPVHYVLLFCSAPGASKTYTQGQDPIRIVA